MAEAGWEASTGNPKKNKDDDPVRLGNGATSGLLETGKSLIYLYPRRHYKM